MIIHQFFYNLAIIITYELILLSPSNPVSSLDLMSISLDPMSMLTQPKEHAHSTL